MQPFIGLPSSPLLTTSDLPGRIPRTVVAARRFGTEFLSESEPEAISAGEQLRGPHLLESFENFMTNKNDP